MTHSTCLSLAVNGRPGPLLWTSQTHLILDHHLLMPLVEEDQYRLAKEASVSGLQGSTVFHINLVSLVALVRVLRPSPLLIASLLQSPGLGVLTYHSTNPTWLYCLAE